VVVEVKEFLARRRGRGSGNAKPRRLSAQVELRFGA
jgi:hypothetical protein